MRWLLRWLRPRTVENFGPLRSCCPRFYDEDHAPRCLEMRRAER